MIDAHVHLWQLGRHDCTWPTPADGPLFRDWRLDDLLPEVEAAGVDQVMLVQSQESSADTAWLLDVATVEPRVAGVVGWADLADRAGMAALPSSPALRGLRPMVQNKAADWYDRPELASGLTAMADRGLVLDALVRPAHLPSLTRLAARRPDLSIVIDHAAKPAGQAGLAAWVAAIAPLVLHPAVWVKVSGLLTELPVEAVPGAIEALLALFGAERLIWGSDWPVVTASSTYRQWLDLARGAVPVADRSALFGGNAARCYRLEPADA